MPQAAVYIDHLTLPVRDVEASVRFWRWRRSATVDAFHAAALAAGGTDNGAPGLRPRHSATYYGGFILDPDS
jgi:catechol 2,3-dioxygenase-like lactoylglutathione lyase family enzyme